ncbi:MAG TPA: sensor histidine kinase [Actinomycetota bacterium]|nr:sensor histidine kinase [Actinomycetota bacterium]
MVDVVVAAGVAVVVIVGSVLAAGLQEPPRPLDAWAYVLMAAAAGALAWRRAAPLVALVGAVAAVGVYLLGGYAYGPIQLCMVVAMFEVARRLPLRASLLACGLAATSAVVFVLARLARDADMPAVLVSAWTGWLVVPWSLGALVQVRSAAAERVRRDLMARAALEERMRVAGEVHDVAGHGFAVVAMQAGIGLLVLEERPDQARESLEAIRATSTKALTELRATLDAFPPPGAAGPPEEIGLQGLGALVERVRASGVPVDLDLTGVDAALPPKVATTAYRVVQESLTNVVRHAGPTRAVVRVTRDADDVVVEVADHGRGPAEPPRADGRGMAGMRARVEALGGTFAAGPRDGGGFQVVARLPLSGGTT